MKKFNINKSRCMSLNGMKIPKGAWYGEDNNGVWVCVHHTPTSAMELYRFNNESEGWYISVEKSRTSKFIAEVATKHKLWNNNVTYYHRNTQFDGLHKIAKNIHQNGGGRYFKSTTLKRVNAEYQKKHEHDTEVMPLDYIQALQYC